MRRLPDSELEVMKALWASGPDTSRAELEEALAPLGLASNTVNTYGGRRVRWSGIWNWPVMRPP